jgi:hypothetical protein
MLILTLIIFSYAYSIFFLGFFRLLYPLNIFIVTIPFTALLGIFIFRLFRRITIPRLDRPSFLLLVLIFLQLAINLIGALGPELSFDALWYHLTLPKIWLAKHFLPFYPGPVFPHSVTPMLTEMLYVPALLWSNEITAKLIHYLFGLLVLVVTYKLGRRYLNRRFSFLAVLIMSSNLVFAWESTVAYADLSRTFLEALALYLILSGRIFSSAVVAGLSIGTKLLSITSLPLYWLILLYKKYSLRHLLVFSSLAVFVVLPWLIHAFLATGNPIYPVFSFSAYTNFSSFNPLDLVTLFIRSTDPISPIYLLLLPLIPFIFKKTGPPANLLCIYCLGSLIVWFFIPRMGGGRFILPYLPAWSVLAALVISNLDNKFLFWLSYISVILVAISTLGYRGIANSRYLPVIIGHESKSHFLSSHLNFSWGDFYDTDNRSSQLIPPGETVLIAGINNLYYVNFPFEHLTARPSGNFNYFLIRYSDVPLPPRFFQWHLLYENPITKVRLYIRP